MANFGSLDYNPRTTVQQEIDDAAPALRAKLLAEGRMVKWPQDNYPVKAGYAPQDVQRYCVRDPQWQETRLRMKGVPTHEKLRICKEWWDQAGSDLRSQGIAEIQVGNYLGALRRGGQLDSENRIRKYI